MITKNLLNILSVLLTSKYDLYIYIYIIKILHFTLYIYVLITNISILIIRYDDYSYEVKGIKGKKCYIDGIVNI